MRDKDKREIRKRKRERETEDKGLSKREMMTKEMGRQMEIRREQLERIERVKEGQVK